MANETYWEITFLDIDNTEKTELFKTESDFDNRWCELYFNPIYNVLNSTSGSNS